MNLSLILFLISTLVFVLNKKNITLMLISIEIILLSTTFYILISSLSFDYILGQIYAIHTIGLGILIVFLRLRDSVAIVEIMCISIIILALLASIVSILLGSFFLE